MPEDYLKFIHSEIATVTKYIGQIYGGDFAKFCGLLRIYELWLSLAFEREPKYPYLPKGLILPAPTYN